MEAVEVSRGLEELHRGVVILLGLVLLRLGVPPAHSAVQYSTVQHSIVQKSTVQYSLVCRYLYTGSAFRRLASVT